ncbi:MAG TPA: DUF2726 domain-containing protein [Tepidisphaeraceae bacterium]|jgi:hypothetical protein|nr:DUF2726 domain-containing protein [Tepidisphaeraceae bacterium]
MSTGRRLFTRTNHHHGAPARLPYRRRSSLLSEGEQCFYRALFAAVGHTYGISLKTRLADLIKCPDRLWNGTPGRRVAQKHVDFVLYDLKTARIIAAIELDDRSHQRPERQVRDAFFDEALSAAGVLLLRVRASSQYNPYAIRRYIELATSHRPR